MTANAAFAQTDTPTPILTWTPEVGLYWTLPPRINEAGTQEAPERDVAFFYYANAGDAAITVLLGVLIFVLWAGFIIWLLLNRKGNSNAGGDRSIASGARDRGAADRGGRRL